MNNTIISVILLISSIVISVDANEPWQSPENWQKLETGLSSKSVEKLLGKPEWVSGGTVTTWRYPNEGKVRLVQDRIYDWSEPAALKGADPISALEQEIQDLKKRVAALENRGQPFQDTVAATDTGKPALTGENR